MSFAVLCPGQGAQHPALFDVVGRHEASAHVLDDARAALGEDPRAWLGQGDAIYRNAVAQPLLCVLQLAQWAALRDDVPRPNALAGYSVGELACYGIAGALDMGALVSLARARATAMDAAATGNPGGLVAVRGLSRASLQRVCEAAGAFIAIVVGDDVFVVGGSDAALDRVRQRSQSAGAKIIELNVGIASHTPLLAEASGEFRSALEQSTLSVPRIPVIAGIDAAVVTSRDRAIATLSAQISRPIEWAQCLDALHERGCRVFIELGPGRALSRMVRERFDDIEARAVDDFGNLAAVAQWVKRRA